MKVLFPPSVFPGLVCRGGRTFLGPQLKFEDAVCLSEEFSLIDGCVREMSHGMGRIVSLGLRGEAHKTIILARCRDGRKKEVLGGGFADIPRSEEGLVHFIPTVKVPNICKSHHIPRCSLLFLLRPNPAGPTRTLVDYFVRATCRNFAPPHNTVPGSIELQLPAVN